MRKITLGAIALALTVAPALPVEIPYTGGLVGSPAVEAGVLGSIKGAARKVGRGVAKKVGGAAKKVGGAAKTAVRTTGRATDAVLRTANGVGTNALNLVEKSPVGKVNRRLLRPVYRGGKRVVGAMKAISR